MPSSLPKNALEKQKGKKSAFLSNNTHTEMVWRTLFLIIVALVPDVTFSFSIQAAQGGPFTPSCSALFAGDNGGVDTTKDISSSTQPVDHVHLSRRSLLFQSLKQSFFLATPTSLIMLANTEDASAQQEVRTVTIPSTSLSDIPPGLFNTVNDVPIDYFTQHQRIYAWVERVTDGDTIRVRHCPDYSPHTVRGTTAPEPIQGNIADRTLKVRLYGVDAPEIAKAKDQISQPFAQEAKDLTVQLVYHQMVELTFLKKDQYSRAICAVQTIPRIPNAASTLSSKDVSVELVRSGLAEIYKGSGAVYFGKQALLQAALQEAQAANRGIWSLGDGRVSAAEAKKCMRSGANANDCIRQGAAASL